MADVSLASLSLPLAPPVPWLWSSSNLARDRWRRSRGRCSLQAPSPWWQILTVTPLQVQNSERFKLEISDGQHFTVARLATQHNGLVKSNQLRPHTILRIREFITNEVAAEADHHPAGRGGDGSKQRETGNPFEYAGDSQGGAGSNKVVAPPPNRSQPPAPVTPVKQPPSSNPSTSNLNTSNRPSSSSRHPSPSSSSSRSLNRRGRRHDAAASTPDSTPVSSNSRQQTSSYTAQAQADSHPPTQPVPKQVDDQGPSDL
ncbi:hypothetical protein BASA81_003883 [Batrachochytrium salamandrivorans]|nr:hypothetical protein BASA81_003883 [Batrachochytrium salamandrivorans]